VSMGSDVTLLKMAGRPNSGDTIPCVVHKRENTKPPQRSQSKACSCRTVQIERWTYVLKVLLTVSVTVLNLQISMHSDGVQGQGPTRSRSGFESESLAPAL
jgi:hypothetical protein